MNNKRNDTLKRLFLILFITAFFSATGQQTNSTAKDSTLVVQPQFIPALKIIDKIEAEKETIKNIYKEIGENDNLVVIDSLLPIYSKFIKDQKNNTENFIKANPNRLKITILSKKWDGYIERLSIWQEDVNTYAKKNSSLAEKIIFNKKTWELTRANSYFNT